MVRGYKKIYQIVPFVSLVFINYLNILHFVHIGTFKKCGAVLSEPSGEFFSPGYNGFETYASWLDCEWTIIIQPGHVVQLLLQMFDMEYEEQCRHDSFQVM